MKFRMWTVNRRFAGHMVNMHTFVEERHATSMMWTVCKMSPDLLLSKFIKNMYSN
jgi:hypothetical protein